MTTHTITEVGPDLWRDEQGTVWVRQAELVEAVKLATKSASTIPVPEELCGKQGARFDGAPPTGSCVFLKGHYELEGQEKHSWQK